MSVTISLRWFSHFFIWWNLDRRGLVARLVQYLNLSSSMWLAAFHITNLLRLYNIYGLVDLMMLSYFKCSHHLAGLTLLYNHKESTAREERGWGRRFFHQIEPTVTDPCRIVPCQYHGWGMPGRRARSPIAFYARVQCREPKTGLERVQFYCEDDILFLSFYYLSMCTTKWTLNFLKVSNYFLF